MLASTYQILQKANRKNYAVGHFNVNNLEFVQAVVKAAEKLKSPVILGTSEGAVKYAGIEYLHSLAETAAKQSSVPLALHLDHAQDLKIIKAAIKIGYSSVMIDASREPFEKNVRITKKVVKLAHQNGVSVEAELGTIGGKEDTIEAKKINYTDPEQAREFVRRTGCNFLAVAIGTSHGAYKFKGRAKLKQNLLQEIKKKIKIPLVLHGASLVPPLVVREAKKYGAKLSGVQGVPSSQIKLAVRNGINKINIDTDLRLGFAAEVRKVIFTQPSEFDPRNILGPARAYIQQMVEERLTLFGSGNNK